MCTFFSFVTDIKGRKYFFNRQQRESLMFAKAIGHSELHPRFDSHTAIAHHNGYSRIRESELNKYEYNPLTKVLIPDTITFEEDEKTLLEWCKSLDFSTIDRLAGEVLAVGPEAFIGKRVKVIYDKDFNSLCQAFPNKIASIIDVSVGQRGLLFRVILGRGDKEFTWWCEFNNLVFVDNNCPIKLRPKMKFRWSWQK